MKYHLASLWVTCDQGVESPVIVGYLEQNYGYRSIATKLSSVAGLLHAVGDRTRAAVCKRVTLPPRAKDCSESFKAYIVIVINWLDDG